jgi:integrase
MIFDKNKQRILELKKELLSETDPEKIERLRKRISKYEAKGPMYYIRFTDSFGKPVVEKVPKEYKGVRGAEKYEAIKIAAVETGTYSPKASRDANVATICDHYLTGKMLGKSGYSSAKTLCNHIKEHIGGISLDKLVKQAEILTRLFLTFPETTWSEKYIWNYRVTLRAAIQFWIDIKELFVYNPVDRVEVDKRINIMEYVPTDADFARVIDATIRIGLNDEIRYMLNAVYETGLRINEVLKWKIEEMDLTPPKFDAQGNIQFIPYFTTDISKQNRIVRKRIPMSKKLWETMCLIVGEQKKGLVFKRQTPPYRMLCWLHCPQCGYRQFDHGNETRTGKKYHHGDYCPNCRTGLLETRHLNQEAGVPYIRPFHDYRKTVKFRNKILKKLPKELTKAFQGHSTDSMDEYYLHLQTNDLYAVVADTWES